ncbi:aryl hydrocarbon receptor nuclear translocator homolog [Musca vetustissima]|uniref:aryl hydrocarbon receptor nuclear translocator homolog n=1 Tax=Musca vetustissima TaxID=27455 RepID=UPI002AB6395B|nr:aryl hydrocarbon receptor nuclear translocator homolog [Musca vetustissima]
MDIMPSQSIVHHPFNIVVNTAMANSSDNSTPTSPVTPTIVSPTATVDANSSTAINGREARNLAEKQRRDKLNASINELAKMVPHVANCPRRPDKTAVLRYATHGLRLQYVFGKAAAARKRALFIGDTHDATDALLQLIDGFFITLTCHGQIVLISSRVEELLGHCQSDLYGQNLLQITHPDDHELLRQQLIPNDIESLFMDYHHHHHHDHNDIHNDDSYLKEIDEKLRLDKRSFTVRLARASTRSESKKVYEFVKIDGSFRRSDYSAISTGASSYPIVSQLIRRSRSASSAHMNAAGGGGNGVGSVGGTMDGAATFIPHLLPHDAIAQAALHGVSGNDIVLIAMARIIRPAKIINYPLEANRLEYKTRHLIDGRIIDCDHRIGLVAGYLQEEVRNLSPFSFMHQDDVRWVIVALRQMYDCNSDTGESFYRLLSRNGNFIYLRTRGYLEIDRQTNKVHSFVCVNTLLDEEEGRRKVQEMKNKFSIIINAKVPTGTVQDATASQNPQQLEKIVLYLIENLQKRQTNTCVVDEIHSEDDVKRHTSTPPLALVPPEPSSVKTSISKSVSVVIATAAKSLVLKSNAQQHSPGGSGGCATPTASEDGDQANTSNETIDTGYESPTTTAPHRPSVLQMRSNSSSSNNNSRSMCQDANATETRIPPHTPENFETAQTTTKIIMQRTQTQQQPDRYNSQKTTKTAVLKRLHSDTIESGGGGHPATKRRLSRLSPLSCMSETTMSSPHSTTCISPAIKSDNSSDIHNFISDSLRHVGESLNRIDVQTSNLLQHRGTMATQLNSQLDAIIVEQQQQNEFLVNIKNEYDVYKEQFIKTSPNRTEEDLSSSDNC